MSAVPVPVYQPKLEIRLSAKDLPRMDVGSKSDPVALVFLSENNDQPREIGRTEKISNTQHPVWQTSIKLEYKFEVLQKLIVRVGDIDGSKLEPIGEVEVSVADVVAQRGRAFTCVLRHGDHKERGSLSITAEEIFQNTTPFKGFVLQCSARGLDAKDINGKSDPYFTIHKLHQDGTNPILVRKSEIVKSTLNPEWKPENIPIEDLCNGDLNRKLLFEVWDWDKIGKHDLIGRFTTSMVELLSGVREFKVINPEKQAKKKHYTDSGSFTFNVKPIQTLSFLQYLQSGIQVSLTVAVDFTASNGDTGSASSLHYLGTSLNEYQEAIQKIGSVVCPYDADQRFALFGFGGDYKNSTNHCFPLNGNDSNPEVVGLQGLLDTYKESVAKYPLSAPTKFAPFLKQARKIAENSKKSGANTYYVVLILTDGQIDDEAASIQEIVDASNDPISIIIVGVGKADFSSMEVLDGDNGKLVSHGKKAQRDIVQFVPFRKHKADPYALAQEVLAEVPQQLVSYYEGINYVPQVPVYPPQQGYPAPHY
eukprot:TRINITY_DN417_c0_g2_i1.p1 TRINITY_DN417_c0_g2~~TRINITY_DN417_c0_g2_i1.p1  ORF type:complete len:536 (+),score=115.33 TRINITY_DN417_c0_g2_i1:31-1638(+)